MQIRNLSSQPRSTVAFRKRLLATSIAVASGTAPPAALAEIEEIVVTATRRAQTTQEIASSISAYSDEFLRENAIDDLNEVARMVPGLSFVDQGSGNLTGDNRLILRGLNANNLGFTGTFTNNTVAPVSTYLGETPVFFPLTLTDLERVEVLRGPQGTLYGSGSLGGTVRFIPKAPDPEKFAVDLEAATSFTDDADDENYDVKAMVNVPISDRAAVRLNVGYREQAGFIDAKGLVARTDDGFFTGEPLRSDPLNPFSGLVLQPTVEDVNDSESWFARVSLLFEPTDKLQLLLSFHHEDAEQGASQLANPNIPSTTIDSSDTTLPGSPGVNIAGCPGGCFGPAAATTFPATGDNDSTKLILDPSEREIDLASLEIEYDLGFASVTSATSYYDKEQTDYTHGIGVWWAPRGLASPNLAYFYGFYPRFTVPLRNIIEEDGLSQEVRMVSTWGKSWDYVVGAFYQDLDYQVDTDQFFPGMNQYFMDLFGFPGANPQLGDQSFFFDKDWQFEEVAVFGELTYHLTDEWQVTAGARVFWQDFETGLVQLLPICGAFCANDFTDPLGRTEAENSSDANDQIFRFSTSYTINEQTMVYATWSEGFRRGGPNAVATAGLFASLERYADYDADKSTNMEVGVKGSLNERVNYSIAAYFMEWEDFQLDTGSPAGAPYVANGDEAESTGIEIEFSAQLTDRFSVSGGYAYNDAEASKSFVLEDATIGGLLFDPPVLTEFTRVNKGDQLPGSLEHSATVAVDYVMPLGERFDLNFHVNGYYRSETSSSFPSTGEGLAFFEYDDFTIWDASVTLASKDWSAALFVNNIGDEEGITGGLSSSQATTVGQYRFVTRPRTVGLRIRYALE